MDMTELKNLSLYELDNIAGLKVGSDADTPKGKQILEGLRDAIVEASDYDRWDVPRGRAEVIHELVDSLVPIYTTDRVKEFAIIAECWHLDLEGFNAYAGAFDFGQLDVYHMDSETTAVVEIGRALYLAYTQAIQNVLKWVEENQPEDEDEDEDEDEG